MEQILEPAGFFAAIGYLFIIRQPQSAMKSAVKTAPLVIFSLLAALEGGPAFLVAGLFLSALGDLALSRPGQSMFLYGLSAFALAHLCYVFTFAAGAPDALFVFAQAPVLAILLVALAVSTELWLIPYAKGLGWPVRAYVWIITAMGLTAAAHPAFLVTAGAVSFIFSDMLLGLREFRFAGLEKRERFDVWVWVFYILGQMMILRGVLAF
ncbi:MAG: hypothetical protein CR993_03745 [Rhodobacterales bacterium]|nr:MAG: hypothetical protein CR993_03745 [Rhodobacterales bacterium]